MMHMRILMLTDDIMIDRRILLEAKTLVDAGNEVIVIALSNGKQDSFEQINGIKIERIDEQNLLDISFSFKVYKRFKNFFQLAKTKKKPLIIFRNLLEKFCLTRNYNQFYMGRISFYQPDIIHVHDYPRLRLGVMAKQKLKIPLIYDSNELYSEICTLNAKEKKKINKFEKKFIKFCDKTIIVNAFLAEEFFKRYRLRPEVILNATKPPQQFDANTHYDLFRQKFDISSNAHILLFQGWMSASRGLQDLVVAMKHVDTNIHLVFMGYGILDELKLLAKQHGVAKRIHFMDAVSQEELLFWTSSADVGIIPYQAVDLNNYYCSPNKLFEFMQAQLPILANDLPFLRQMVFEQNIGEIAEFNSPKNYASAISAIFDNFAEKKQIYKKHLIEAAKQYHWDTEGEKIKKIYEDLM